MSEVKINNQIKKYMCIITVVAIVTFLRFYDCICTNYNTTLLAFSYKYGFISRGLIGTIYQSIDSILPVDMMTYAMAMRFTEVVTVVFLLIILLSVYYLLKKSSPDMQRSIFFVCLLLVIMLSASFASKYNFGRIDLYMIIMSLFAMILIMEEKALVLVLPLMALGVMFHQGYVFMYANIPLALLFYKAFKSEKKQKFYRALLVAAIVTVSVLFLWFQLKSHSGDMEIFDEVITNATAVSYEADPHEDLVRAEILGVDLTEEERKYFAFERKQLIWTAIFFAPYIAFIAGFFAKVVKACDNKIDKAMYSLIAIGAATMIPDFMMKIDYGRWVMAVMVYYYVVIMALIVMKDKAVIYAANQQREVIKNKPYFGLLLAYPLLFLPCQDVVIFNTIDKFLILFNIN